MMQPCPPSSTSEQQQASSSRSRKPLGPTLSSSAAGQSRGSMNDIFHKQHSSSDEEDEADLSNANAQANKKGNMKQGHNRSKDSSRLNGSAKNLSVRFEPSQVQTSPQMEHQQLQQQQQPPPHGRKGHHGHHSHHGHHRKGHHHRSRRAQSRQPERANYYHHQAAMIPRSHSYSGQVGLQESLAHMGHPVSSNQPNSHQIPMLNRHQSPHVGRRPPPVQQQPPSMMPNNNYYSNYHSHHQVSSAGFVEELDDDVCSTCSSSSSDSDDPYAYQLPPRKAYGGVRLSYVPNDRIRARNHQRSIQGGPHSSEYVPQHRHSMRGGSVQPQSLPPAAPRQQQQQQPHQHQQQLPPRHPDYHPMHHHHAQQQPQPQQQQQQYAHPGPASGSSVGSKDKDKCIIS